jgi:hypothetical protein
MRFNSQAYNLLPDGQKGKAEAVLLEYDISGNTPKALWLFLLNPQTLKFLKTAEYNEIKPLGSKVSQMQYTSSGGISLSISELILQTWYCGKSLRPLLEGVQKLMEADIKNKKYSPPILKFQMGAREFGPCVLTKLDWDESAWLGGEPASVRLNLELREVPKVVSRGEIEKAKEKATESAKTTREQQGKPRLPLTDRQRSDGSAAAKKYLEININSWAADVQAAIRGSKYKLATDKSSGQVVMNDATGKKLGVVLVWDGATGKAGAGITTIATMKNVKPPEYNAK